MQLPALHHHSNRNNVSTADVNGNESLLYNVLSGRIATANVSNGGHFYGNGYGIIVTANANEGGFLLNFQDGTILEANVNKGGQGVNYGYGRITEANVDEGGSMYNRENATITTANVYGGSVSNYENAQITNAYAYDNGRVHNYGNAQITNAYSDFGKFINCKRHGLSLSDGVGDRRRFVQFDDSEPVLAPTLCGLLGKSVKKGRST